MKKIKVSIKDYQIIKQAVLDFEPGLTVLVGPSNNGKSSIVKAIKAALYTEPGSTPIRHGAKFYLVGIQDNGHVIAYQKKDGSSKYLVDGKSYSKFGVNTPEEVSNALNIKELVLNGNKVQLNFWDQMDKPFLLDKSAGELFKFIVDSGENDQLSSVLKSMVTDRQSLNKEADNIQGQIDALEKSIKHQESQLEKLNPILEKAISVIENKNKVDIYRDINKLIEEYKITQKRIENTQNNIIKLNQKENLFNLININKFNDLEYLKNTTNKILDINLKFSNLNIVNNQLICNLNALNKIDLMTMPQILNLINTYEIILFKIKDKSQTILTLQKVVPNENVIEKIQEKVNLVEYIEKIEAINYRQNEINLIIEQKELHYKDEIKPIEKLFKVCPVCGQALKGGKHNVFGEINS